VYVALCSALLCSLLAPALCAQQDEIVSDFQKAFPRFKERPERIEAVRTLEAATSAAVIDVLAGLFKDRDVEVARTAEEVLGAIKTDEVRAAVRTRAGEEKDARTLTGLLKALGSAKDAAGAPIARAHLAHKELEVRLAAARAVAALRDKEALPLLVALVADKENVLRIAALDALGDLGDPSAGPAIAPALADGDWQVKAAAVAAARKVRAKEPIPALVGLLRDEGRIAADAMQALVSITGDSYDRADLWERWWERVGARYVVPTAAELKALAEAKKASQARYGPVREDGTEYHGIETPSKRILFIIDVSGSMDELVIDRAAFEGRGYKSYTKMEIAKGELSRTIEGLGPNVRFNILAFAAEVIPWKKGLTQANVVSRSNALKWIERLQPIGGTSAQALSSALGGGDLEKGRTNTFGALSAGFDLAGRGTQDRYYQSEIDTIFFLSDGRPTAGELVETRDIVERICEINQLKKLVLHTIAIGQFQKDFMRDLAVRNGGVFIDLGK
jgi:HEAT repeat protein